MADTNTPTAAQTVTAPPPERKRKLSTVTWSSGGTAAVKLPLDSYLKYLSIHISGDFVATYSSAGTFAPTSHMDALIQRVDVTVNDVTGGRTPKSVRPYIAQCMSMIYSGEKPSSRYINAATANALPKSAANVEVLPNGQTAFPTSTQHQSFFDHMMIPFQVPATLADDGQATYLKTQGKPDAQVLYSFGAASNLDTSGDVTISSAAITIDTYVIDVNYVGKPGDPEYDFKESVDVVQLTGSITEFAQRLNRGVQLVGLALLAETNMSATGSVEATKFLNNNLLTGIRVNVDNLVDVKVLDFSEQQCENVERYGANSRKATLLSPMDGFCYIPFIENHKLGSALDLRQSNDVFLKLSTNVARATAPFITFPAQISVLKQELVRVA